MSPEFPAACVPTTASLEIASPPTVMSVQFAPRLPFALLKLSEAAPVPPGVAQVTETLVTLPEPTTPDPLATLQT